MSTLSAGAPGSPTDPAILIGNDLVPSGTTETWIITNSSPSIAGISTEVLGIAKHNGGETYLIAFDKEGDLGVGGYLSIQGLLSASQPAAITVGSGDPNSAGLNLPIGSLYIRTDSTDPGGPRLFQYQYCLDDMGDPSALWRQVAVAINLYSVMDYGARGDGVADDLDAIQAAFQACFDNGGGCVYFPAGQYSISAAIDILSTNHTIICGAGMSSQVRAAGDFNIFEITHDSSAKDLIIRDIYLLFPDADPGLESPTQAITGAAIYITVSITDTRFYNVRTDYVAYGVSAIGLGGGRNVSVGCKFDANFCGVYIDHGMDFTGCRINGGTYGLVMNNANGGMKLTNCPLFGVLSLWAADFTADPDNAQGNSIYLYDCETNYGPPPENGVAAIQAYGTVTLSGTLVNGESIGVTINGGTPIATSTTGEVSIAAMAAAIASNINGALSPGTVHATSSGSVVTITAGTDPPYYGFLGNNMTLSATSSAHLTATTSGSHLTHGHDAGIWPGDSTDTFNMYANGATLGSGGFLFQACRSELHLVNTWCQDSTVIGNNSGDNVWGPTSCSITAGNFGASVKGQNQISTHSIDVLSCEVLTISGAHIHQGGGSVGATLHLGQDASATTAVSVVTGCYINPSSNNYAIIIDSVNNTFLIADNLIQSDISGSPISLPASSGFGESVIRDNVGFNPTGLFKSSLGLGAHPQTNLVVQNTFAVDGYFNIRGLSVTIKILDITTGTYNAIGGMTAGGLIWVPAGGSISLTYTGSDLTTQQFFGE